MSVMIATPCYAGLLHVGYFRFAHALTDVLTRENIEFDFLVTEGESLVTRARNNLAATFLASDFDTLAFIDADIEMSPYDFVKLYRLPGVRGAAVNMKRQDAAECLSAFKGGEQLKRSEMPSEPFSVDFLGSAVLLLDREILASVVATGGVSAYSDPIVGPAWDFFQVGVLNETYLSEDFGFCELVRAAGHEITCHPDVRVKHYGSFCFSA